MLCMWEITLPVAVVGLHNAVWPAYLDTELSAMEQKTTNCNRVTVNLFFFYFKMGLDHIAKNMITVIFSILINVLLS